MNTIVFGQSTEGPLSGSTSSNVSLTGSSASWSNTANALSSDNSYASSSLSSNGDFTDYLQITNFGFNISASNTIVGIEVEIEKFGDKVKDNQVRIVKGGSISTTDQSDNANWPNTDPNSYTLYGANNDLWGETWLPTDINASDFGIAISARRVGGGGGSAVPNIDHIRITVYFEIPLPVKLTHFSARAEGTNARLQWETGWEEGNSHFEIERSTNALQFESIGFVPGGNNSSERITYHYVDEAPNPGQNYYRLKQYDFNGSFSFSEIVRVAIQTPVPEYHVISNPLTSETTFIINDPSPEAYTLGIIDPSGKIVRKFYPNTRETQISRSHFPGSGLYFYRLTRQNRLQGSGKFWVR
ncbi:MAG: T9SS type A sorting domain-containing protein [Roseivirga sp.]|nr:T9SS type A sorting domain-containing protein [Roseivirga sp.]